MLHWLLVRLVSPSFEQVEDGGNDKHQYKNRDGPIEGIWVEAKRNRKTADSVSRVLEHTLPSH